MILLEMGHMSQIQRLRLQTSLRYRKMEMEIIQVLSFAVLGAAYAVYWRLSKNADPEKPTIGLDTTKILATAIIGGVIGAGSYIMGFEMTYENAASYLLSAGFAIAFVERTLMTVVNRIRGE